MGIILDMLLSVAHVSKVYNLTDSKLRMPIPPVRLCLRCMASSSRLFTEPAIAPLWAGSHPQLPVMSQLVSSSFRVKCIICGQKKVRGNLHSSQLVTSGSIILPHYFSKLRVKCMCQTMLLMQCRAHTSSCACTLPCSSIHPSRKLQEKSIRKKQNKTLRLMLDRNFPSFCIKEQDREEP